MSEKEVQGLSCTGVRPVRYQIHLKPNLKDLTFVGSQKVNFLVTKSTKALTLDTTELVITYAAYKREDGKTVDAKTVNADPKTNTSTIHFPEELAAGNSGSLMLKFEGKINQEKVKGFYLGQTSMGQEVKKCVYTHMEPNYASRCFPCWDHPAKKAKFRLIFTVEQDLEVLSNMPVDYIGAKPSATLRTWVFQETKLMSTYLVAAAIGFFGFIERKSGGGTPIRIYTPKGIQNSHGTFALDTAVRSLDFYESVFKIEYPLPKLDLVAVPQFPAGGMENWGLIFYHESRLLVDLENSSALSRQECARTIAHEVAHQWFGNLVTMQWWSDLWLNEGFAVFMETLCVEKLFPDFKYMSQFIPSRLLRGLEVAAFENSPSIHVDIQDASTAVDMFNDVTYNLAASVLKMIYSYVGDDVFMKGVSTYLNAYSYSNATAQDLWNSLEKESGKTKRIKELLQGWVTQKGYPLLNVKIGKPCSDSMKTTVFISQNRFLADSSEDRDGYTWIIPLEISTSESPTKPIIVEIMNEKFQEIQIPKFSWIKLNSGHNGVFRTLYDDYLFKQLVTAVEKKSLQPSDRLGLLDDTYALFQAGKVSFEDFFSLLKVYSDECDLSVLKVIIKILKQIEIYISSRYEESLIKQFRIFGCKILADVKLRVGDLNTEMKSENHVHTSMRSEVLCLLVRLEDQDLCTKLIEIFKNKQTKNSPIPADLEEAVFRAAIQMPTKDALMALETMMKWYVNSTDIREKECILSSIVSSENEVVLKEMLKLWNDSRVSDINDKVRILASMGVRSNKGRPLAWEFVKNNWDKILKKVDGFLLIALVKNVTTHHVEEAYAVDIEHFFSSVSDKRFEFIKLSLKNIRFHTKAAQFINEKALRNFFAKCNLK